MDTNISALQFSLLRPQDGAPPAGLDRWGENTMEDLDLEQLAWDLSIDNKYHDPIHRILLELCSDIDTITYRQEILEDFLKFPALAAGLRDLLPTFAKLKRYAETGSQKIPLQETLKSSDRTEHLYHHRPHAPAPAGRGRRRDGFAWPGSAAAPAGRGLPGPDLPFARKRFAGPAGQIEHRPQHHHRNQPEFRTDPGGGDSAGDPRQAVQGRLVL